MAKTKQCSECKRVLQLTAFYKLATCKDGRLNICKVCKRAYSAEMRKLKAPEIRASYAAWHERNRERKRTVNRAWRHTPRGRELRNRSNRIYRRFKALVSA